MAVITPQDHLRELLRLIRASLRFRRVAAVVILIGVAISVTVSFVIKPRYQSETLIMYRELIPSSALDIRGSEDTRNLGPRLRDILLSRTLLDSVLTEFKLYPEVVAKNGRVEAIEELKQKLHFSVRGATTFVISYIHVNPDTAQKVTARVAELLIRTDTESRQQQASVTTDFLKAEAARSEEEVKIKEREVASFIAKHPEYTLPASAGGSGQSAQTRGGNQDSEQNIDTQLMSLEREQATLLSRLNASSSGDSEDAPAAPQSGFSTRAALETALRERDTAASEFVRVSQQLTAMHPDVVAAKKHLEEAESRLSAIEGKMPPGVANAARAERAQLSTQLRLIQTQVNQLRRRREQAPPTAEETAQIDAGVVERETEWQTLNRELADARERLETLDARLFTAQIVASSSVNIQSERLKVIDPAYKPSKPAGQTRLGIIAAGCAVSMLLGGVTAVGLALVDDHVATRYDIARLGVAPLLVEIPALRRKKQKREAKK